MAKTTFVDHTTVIEAEWLNEVGVAIFDAIGDGTNAPTTAAQVKANLGVSNGDVIGPATSILDRVAVFADATGKIIKDGGATLASKANSGANTDITSLASPAIAAATATTQAVTDSSTKVATTAFVHALIPAGTMFDYAGTATPTGYLLCDGTAVSRATYATLFTNIGTTWGVGDGVNTFNLPDFRRRVAVGSGGSGTGTLGNATGNTGGAETHTLTTAEMPAHVHAGVITNTGGAAVPGGGGYDQGSTASTGGGGAHNNMQPSAVVTKIIKI